MTKKKAVPEVRFKGFEGEWEERALGELGNVAMNRRIFKHETSEVGDVPFYKIGTFGRMADAFISKALFEEYKSKYPYPTCGDLLISASGSIGKVVEYTGKDEYFQDSNIVWLQHDNKLANSFLKQFYLIVKWHGLEGSTIKRLYNSHILKTNIFLPSADEQTRIGELFRNLDARITLEQRKYEKLQNIKKAMLEKMFPKPSATVPEVRFKGFEGEWEEKKFFETIDQIIDFRGRTPKKLGFEWSNDGYLALSALNVKDGYIDTTVDAHYGSQDLYEAWMKSSDLHAGQVLFTTEAPMGNVAQVPDNKKYILSQRVIAFKVDQQILAENFLAVILRVPEVHTRLCSLASGGTAKGVSQRSLAEVKILIPDSPKEQTRIGDFFRNLDSLITLQQRKCEKLHNIKKAMLGKMFV